MDSASVGYGILGLLALVAAIAIFVYLSPFICLLSLIGSIICFFSGTMSWGIGLLVMSVIAGFAASLLPEEYVIVRRW